MASTPTRFYTIWKFMALSGMALVLSTCGGGIRDSSRGGGGDDGMAALEVWTVSADPQLEIGVREGDDPYQLDRATGSTLLPDGRVVVLDGGSGEVRFFDGEGIHLASVGGDGEGPGEFRNPTRLRRTVGDSIQVWDAGLGRLSFFDLQGGFLGTVQVPPEPEEAMPLDEWLFGRNWIDSPVTPDMRGAIRQAIGAMPPPDSVGPPRFLTLTRQGRIWAATHFPPIDQAQEWTVYDLEGRALARVEIPARFDLHEVGPEYLLGRYRDDLDLNFIRLYGLERPEGSPMGPGLDGFSHQARALAGGSGEGEMQELSDELRALMFEAVRATASAQEIHYSQHYTYIRDVQLLFQEVPGRFEVPEGVDVAVLAADVRGWIGTFSHRATGLTCGLAYGASRPMGWSPGSLICP